MAVLALDASGVPRTWITVDDAISYHAKGLVAWSMGEVIARYRGGVQGDGSRSCIETPSIIAVKGKGFDFSRHNKVILTNETLFARDHNLCAYCGTHHVQKKHLSRDHIVPRFLGGKDEWTNVVTACIPCNQKKGCKTLKQAGMELLYVPYEPNHYERLLLSNRSILSDQMEYLLTGVPENSRARLMLAA